MGALSVMFGRDKGRWEVEDLSRLVALLEQGSSSSPAALIGRGPIYAYGTIAAARPVEMVFNAHIGWVFPAKIDITFVDQRLAYIEEYHLLYEESETQQVLRLDRSQTDQKYYLSVDTLDRFDCPRPKPNIPSLFLALFPFGYWFPLFVN